MGRVGVIAHLENPTGADIVALAEAAEAAGAIVGDLVVRERKRFAAGEATTELADGPAMPVITVLDKTDLAAVDAIYGDVPALQIVWTDSAGHLPWEPGYANPPGSQRLLGPR